MKQDTSMRNCTLGEACADLDAVIERALGGEPQRVVRAAGEAVIVVAEACWREQPIGFGDFGAALMALGEAGAFAELGAASRDA
jgi:hypothetical protein